MVQGKLEVRATRRIGSGALLMFLAIFMMLFGGFAAVRVTEQRQEIELEAFVVAALMATVPSLIGMSIVFGMSIAFFIFSNERFSIRIENGIVSGPAKGLRGRVDFPLTLVECVDVCSGWRRLLGRQITVRSCDGRSIWLQAFFYPPKEFASLITLLQQNARSHDA